MVGVRARLTADRRVAAIGARGGPCDRPRVRRPAAGGDVVREADRPTGVRRPKAAGGHAVRGRTFQPARVRRPAAGGHRVLEADRPTGVRGTKAGGGHIVLEADHAIAGSTLTAVGRCLRRTVRPTAAPRDGRERYHGARDAPSDRRSAQRGGDLQEPRVTIGVGGVDLRSNAGDGTQRGPLPHRRLDGPERARRDPRDERRSRARTRPRRRATGGRGPARRPAAAGTRDRHRRRPRAASVVPASTPGSASTARRMPSATPSTAAASIASRPWSRWSPTQRRTRTGERLLRPLAGDVGDEQRLVRSRRDRRHRREHIPPLGTQRPPHPVERQAAVLHGRHRVPLGRQALR